MVDASAIGVGTVLLRADGKEQMQLMSYNSRLFNECEQKVAILSREITAIVYALEVYEFLIHSSNHPITIFTDQRPIRSIFARKVT